MDLVKFDVKMPYDCLISQYNSSGHLIPYIELQLSNINIYRHFSIVGCSLYENIF